MEGCGWMWRDMEGYGWVWIHMEGVGWYGCAHIIEYGNKVLPFTTWSPVETACFSLAGRIQALTKGSMYVKPLIGMNSAFIFL